MELELSLISRVRRGEINFERLVEVLSTRGYITDSDGPDGLGFGRVAIDQARQYDFDALFKVLMPGRANTITLRHHSTAEGGMPGLFTNALFNADVIDYEELNLILIEMNRKELRQL